MRRKDKIRVNRNIYWSSGKQRNTLLSSQNWGFDIFHFCYMKIYHFDRFIQLSFKYLIAVHIYGLWCNQAYQPIPIHSLQAACCTLIHNLKKDSTTTVKDKQQYSFSVTCLAVWKGGYVMLFNTRCPGDTVTCGYKLFIVLYHKAWMHVCVWTYWHYPDRHMYMCLCTHHCIELHS